MVAAAQGSKGDGSNMTSIFPKGVLVLTAGAVRTEEAVLTAGAWSRGKA